MGYYAGDIPALPLMIEPALDVDDFDSATAVLVSPVPDVDDVELDAELQDGVVIVEWPAPPSVIPTPGVYDVRVTLHTVGGALQRLPQLSLIVQGDEDGWHTLDSIREVWADAPENDRWLYELLETARYDCLQYRPDAVAKIPAANRRRAQQLHARDLWNAAAVDTSGGLGEGTFTLQPHPLDWMVKQLLRPKTGTFVVG